MARTRVLARCHSPGGHSNFEPMKSFSRQRGGIRRSAFTPRHTDITTRQWPLEHALALLMLPLVLFEERRAKDKVLKAGVWRFVHYSGSVRFRHKVFCVTTACNLPPLPAVTWGGCFSHSLFILLFLFSFLPLNSLMDTWSFAISNGMVNVQLCFSVRFGSCTSVTWTTQFSSSCTGATLYYWMDEAGSRTWTADRLAVVRQGNLNLDM
ncbi:hypothetical protein J3F83DRAFT_721346 [Trichoderma novae-zelandiae]